MDEPWVPELYNLSNGALPDNVTVDEALRVLQASGVLEVNALSLLLSALRMSMPDTVKLELHTRAHQHEVYS